MSQKYSNLTLMSRSVLRLTDAQRRTLERWARGRTTSQARGLRARVVLARAEAPTDRAVAERLAVSARLVARWRARFLTEGLDGLDERPRPGRPRVVTDTAERKVARQLLADPPAGAAAWSTRSLAEATGISQTSVSRIVRTLVPGTRKAGLPGKTPVLTGLLFDGTVRAVAVTVAEETPMRPSGSRRPQGHSEVVRALAAVRQLLDITDEPEQRRDAPVEFRRFLDELHQTNPPGNQVHVLVESESVRADPRVAQWLNGRSRLDIHPFTGDADWASTLETLTAGTATATPHLLSELRSRLREWLTRPSKPVLWIPGRRQHVHNTFDSPGESYSPPATAEAGVSPAVDRVAQALREQIAGGHFPPGERIRETQLAAQLGLSRGPVRDALRVLAEDGLVEIMPNRRTTIPMVTADRVLEVYAVRGALGAMLLRRLATLEPQSLRPVGVALAELRRVIRSHDPVRTGDADLAFQDAIAAAARLRHTSVFFQRLTMQLRMFTSILKLDYADMPVRIERTNAAIFKALHEGHSNDAVQFWQEKMNMAVRYMIMQLPMGTFNSELWLTIQH